MSDKRFNLADRSYGMRRHSSVNDPMFGLPTTPAARALRRPTALTKHAEQLAYMHEKK